MTDLTAKEKHTMKFIPYVDGDGLRGRELLVMIAGQAAFRDGMPQGFTAAEARKRHRVLDALEQAKDAPGVSLEDADYDLLRGLTLNYPFVAVNGTLIKFLDAVEHAKAPPAVVKPQGKAKSAD